MPSSLSEATYLLLRLGIQAVGYRTRETRQTPIEHRSRGKAATNSLVEPVKDENVCRDLCQLSIVQRRAR